MKRIKDKICDLEVKALCGLRSFLKDEKGDTNFISIAIILIVVAGIAAAFISMGNTVRDKFTENVSKFTENLG